MKNNSFKVFLLLFCLSFVLFACKNKQNTQFEPGEAPDTQKSSGTLGLDFIAMHNSVIDTLSSEFTPFFFIKDGEFDISGDNDKNTITVSCNCMKGTTVQDVDLFLSLVLQYIGFNAAEQDFRFKAPTTDDTSTFINFGTVFDTYNLELKAKTEDGQVLHDDYIKKGSKIPIDPRYWSE